jgi:hypothetical protein
MDNDSVLADRDGYLRSIANGVMRGEYLFHGDVFDEVEEGKRVAIQKFNENVTAIKNVFLIMKDEETSLECKNLALRVLKK